MELQDNIKQFIDKVKKAEKGEILDLSSDEDLSMGVMNLISMEEHFFFTFNKTKDEKYLDLLNEVRQMRKELLKRLIKDYEGEVWCISKHLLAASMRLMEVGTKALTKGDKKDAADLFQKSYQLYSLFMGLNLGLIDSKSMEHVKTDNEHASVPNNEPTVKNSGTIMARLGRFVQKMVDCCKE